MREVLSFLFDIFTDPLGLPIAGYWEWIILAIIAFSAYAIAFRTVGDLYDGGMISGSAAGSILHWIIRLIVFVVIWAITKSHIVRITATNHHISLCDSIS